MNSLVPISLGTCRSLLVINRVKPMVLDQPRTLVLLGTP